MSLKNDPEWLSSGMGSGLSIFFFLPDSTLKTIGRTIANVRPARYSQEIVKMERNTIDSEANEC